MSGFNNSHLLTTMPPQKVSSAKKQTSAWQKSSVDAIVGKGNMLNAAGRTTAQEKQIKYDIVNSIVDKSDKQFITNPYGRAGGSGAAAKLRDINQIFNKISLLKGEEINRPFNIRAISVAGEAIIEKDNAKKDMILQLAQRMLIEARGENAEPVIDPNTGEEVEPTFEGIEKYANYKMQDIREKWANDILAYILKEQQAELKFNTGWEHGLIVAEEIYYTGIVNKNPVFRVCNPLNCNFDRNPDVPEIEKGDWFREERWMTVGQILDEYGDVLTDAQVTKLDKGDVNSSGQYGMLPGYAYEQNTMDMHSNYNAASGNRDGNHILVTNVVWRSMMKIGFLTIPDIDGGEPEEIQMPDTFKLSNEMKAQGCTLEWRWLNDIWQGTKIDDMYLNVQSVENQPRSMDNPFYVPLPYVGRVYNSTNTQQTSFVDLIKPHQEMLNTVWYRLENEIAKAGGKKFVFDIAQLPKAHGWDFDKFMYMFDNVGIAVINSMEEGTGRQQGKFSSFNGFTSIDMTLSQSIGQYITIIGKIEQTIDKIVGITPQREGQVHQSETVGGVERAVSASSHITEPWFYIHNEVKKAVVTQLMACAKLAYPKTKRITMLVDDVQRINSTVNTEMFADSDYGIFFTDSSKEHQTFQKLEALASQALASGAAQFSDIIKMYNTKSIGELSRMIETTEIKKQQQEAQAGQQQQEMQQEMIAHQEAIEDKKMTHESDENRLDREARLQEATIKAVGFDSDTTDNGVLDVIQQSEFMLKQRDSDAKQRESENKRSIEKEKIMSQQTENEKDRALKRAEMHSKERIAKDNNKTALKNKVPGEGKK